MIWRLSLEVFRKIKNKKKKKRNTIILKYQTVLEEKNKLNEKIINLQEEIIALQKINQKQKEELLVYKEQEMDKLREKIRKLGEKK